MYNEETYDKVVLEILKSLGNITVSNREETIILLELEKNIYQFLGDYTQYRKNIQILDEYTRGRK